MSTKDIAIKDRRNPLKTARGLDPSQSGVGHWWTQRVTAAALVLLGLWFVVTVLCLLHADYATAHAAVAKPWNALLLIAFVLTMFWHAVLGLQVVIDGGDPLSILWQVLPYALLTFGEVLVSATGLEFAYSQAPASMKGVVMSFWNLTTTIGNLWVLLANAAVRNERVTGSIASTGLSVTAFQMFFFAAFALLAALAFGLYARRYREVDYYRSG